MHYFENLYNYPRKRLITDVRHRYPTFPRDLESLEHAIFCVSEERNWHDMGPSFPQPSVGGIIDWGDSRDVERETLGSDASYDGSLPAPGTYYPPHSDFVVHGDDGSMVPDDGFGQFNPRAVQMVLTGRCL